MAAVGHAPIEGPAGVGYLLAFDLSRWASESLPPSMRKTAVEAHEIPLPLATQQAIVAEIEAEQALVAASRELITRFEQEIQATLARVWGKAAATSDDTQHTEQAGSPEPAAQALEA